MAYVIKNLKITWDWSGDIYAVLGFNVAITPVGVEPTDEIVVLAQTGKEKFEHTFRQITLKDGIEYTAWVQAIYENKDSQWISVSGFIANDDGTATITTKDQHDALLDETVNYRTKGSPTNEPTPTNIVVNENSNGSLDIRVEWAPYSQGVRKADMLILFWKKGDTSGLGVPTTEDSNVSFSVNESNSAYYLLEGLAPNTFYRFGIAAARRTENGLEIGNIVSPASWTDVDVGDATINHDNVNGSAGGGTFLLDENGIRHTSGSFSIDPDGNAHFEGEIVIGGIATSTNDLETQSGAQSKADSAQNFAEKFAQKTNWKYEGEWHIGSAGEGYDFEFGPIPDKYQNYMELKLRHEDLESAVNILVNGNVAVDGIRGSMDNYSGWESWELDPAHLNSSSDNVIRVEHDGSVNDWGHIYQIELNFDSKRYSEEQATKAEENAKSYSENAVGAVENWTSDTTNYTTISGGVVRTGQIQSENYEPQTKGAQVDLDSGIIDFGGRLYYEPNLGLLVNGTIYAEDGYISDGVTVGAEGKSILKTINESVKEKVNVKPEGGKLWHFDKHFTSTQGEMITIIKPV
jgi:hypothetical protein